MARLPRFVLPGHPEHIIQRGNNRNAIFKCNRDYHCYRKYLLEASQRHGVAIHAYVLMTNHVHMIMTPQTENGISKVMQSLGCRYTQYFNGIYKRTGPLWDGRYRATLIDTEAYLLTCYRYIELNPVRAKMVSRPDKYPWSSYHANALGQYDKLLTLHELYLRLDQTNDLRMKAYRGLFDACMPDEELARIRGAINKSWVLGDEQFQHEIEDLANRRVRPLPKGGVRNSNRV